MSKNHAAALPHVQVLSRDSAKTHELTSEMVRRILRRGRQRKFSPILRTSVRARFQVETSNQRGSNVQTDTSGETVTNSESTIANGKNSGEENSCVQDKGNTQDKQAKDSIESANSDPSDETTHTTETSKDAKSQEQRHKDQQEHNKEDEKRKDAPQEDTIRTFARSCNLHASDEFSSSRPSVSSISSASC